MTLQGTAETPAPAFVTFRSALDSVRLALVGLGAVAQTQRSVALDLGDQLLLLDADPKAGVTTVAVGGPDALSTATWVAAQLEDAGCVVDSLIPPPARVSS